MWPRVLAGGILWAAVYNLVWGVAWFAFMRNEWIAAMAAIHRRLPFNADIWIFWIALTLPIGMAIIAYAAGPAHSDQAAKAAIYASAALWLLMTLGMAVWAWQQSIHARTVALDSLVNLTAMVVASLAGGRIVRRN